MGLVRATLQRQGFWSTRVFHLHKHLRRASGVYDLRVFDAFTDFERFATNGDERGTIRCTEGPGVAF